jgi:hypothetical protein
VGAADGWNEIRRMWMAGGKAYRVNKPSVIQEVLEGEAVIVNLATGSYYSTENSGATIWNLLAQGPTTVPEIVTHLQTCHSEIPKDVDRVVEQWLDVLERESLLVGELREADTTSGPTRVVAEEVPIKTPFVEPKVEKYTDMEDLLLLDPIHDVQETGWPRAAEDPAS